MIVYYEASHKKGFLLFFHMTHFMVSYFLSPSKPFLSGAICPSFLSSFSRSSGEDVPFLRSKDILTVTPHFSNLVALMIPSLYFYLQLTPFNKQTLSSLIMFFWALSLNY